MATMNDVQRRSEFWFAKLDRDGDGSITAEDFTQLSDHITSSFPQADPEKVQAVKQAYASLWDDLAAAADSDNDGRVTQDEFRASLENTPRVGFERAAKRAALEFSLADADGDGYLDTHEFTKMIQLYGHTGDVPQQVLSLIDTDNDGRVSIDEWQKAVLEHLVGRDPFSSVS
ncbi:EF-hand domain-containing protein [Streptomyces sp. G45]|uniref:EF-hand domain-containing protein n=1 Tax=Streptomyces sp. G45 TaxID=3406627 RepID=UPI003C1EEABF